MLERAAKSRLFSWGFDLTYEGLKSGNEFAALFAWIGF